MRSLAAAGLILAAAACSKSTTPAAPPPPAPPAAEPAGHAAAQMPGGHPSVAATRLPDEAAAKLAALQERVAKEPRAFEPAVLVADLYYDNARYPDAVDAYRAALERSAETLALYDELVAKKPAPATDLAGCEAGAGRVEANDKAARALRDKGDAPHAFACARQAVAPLFTAMSRRASALFLVGNIDSALGEYEKLLQRDPDMADPLFFTGALLINRRGANAADFARAQKSWEHFLRVAPKDHPRRGEVEKTLPQIAKALENASGALAGPVADQPDELPAGHPAIGGDAKPGRMGAVGPVGAMGGMGAPGSGMAMPEGHPAVEGAPAPADVDKALDQAEEALAKGDGAAAARLYMGAMSARPDDGRVQAGLAASQFLKGSAMAERVFNVAATHDPKAVDELAGRLKAKGNPGLSRTLLQQLATANPEYSEKAKVRDRAK
jgi:tetratricopeptide (TPR) repeat protein